MFCVWSGRQRIAFLSEYLQSVCSVADEGTDRNPDKYVLRLHCSLGCVCMCVFVKLCICICIRAWLCRPACVPLQQSSADSVVCPSIPASFLLSSVSVLLFEPSGEPPALPLPPHPRTNTCVCTLTHPSLPHTQQHLVWPKPGANSNCGHSCGTTRSYRT